MTQSAAVNHGEMAEKSYKILKLFIYIFSASNL